MNNKKKKKDSAEKQQKESKAKQRKIQKESKAKQRKIQKEGQQGPLASKASKPAGPASPQGKQASKPAHQRAQQGLSYPWCAGLILSFLSPKLSMFSSFFLNNSRLVQKQRQPLEAEQQKKLHFFFIVLRFLSRFFCRFYFFSFIFVISWLCSARQLAWAKGNPNL